MARLGACSSMKARNPFIWYDFTAVAQIAGQADVEIIKPWRPRMVLLFAFLQVGLLQPPVMG